MPDKVVSAIRRMLGKNEKTAGKAKKKLVVENVAADSARANLSEEDLINAEIKRRSTFARKTPKFNPSSSDTTASDEALVGTMAAEKSRIQNAVYGKGVKAPQRKKKKGK